MKTPSEALGEIRERMADAIARSGRSAGAARLIAVTKTATTEALHALYEAGQTAFAHNYVQRLEEQHAALPKAEWHMIGPLQSNKAAKLLAMADWLQTFTDPAKAARLDRLAGKRGRPLQVLVQVDLVSEGQRNGCSPDEVEPALEALAAATHLAPRGLMTMPLPGSSERERRHSFATLRELAERFVTTGLLPARFELSCGMSDDFETAIEEGATLVRIGRALFPPPSPAA